MQRAEDNDELPEGCVWCYRAWCPRPDDKDGRCKYRTRELPHRAWNLDELHRVISNHLLYSESHLGVYTEEEAHTVALESTISFGDNSFAQRWPVASTAEETRAHKRSRGGQGHGHKRGGRHDRQPEGADPLISQVVEQNAQMLTAVHGMLSQQQQQQEQQQIQLQQQMQHEQQMRSAAALMPSPPVMTSSAASSTGMPGAAPIQIATQPRESIRAARRSIKRLADVANACCNALEDEVIKLDEALLHL